MKIELKKFGSTLVSRDAGKEALAAIRPILDILKQEEILEVSFEGVMSLTPSWASEFLDGLIKLFGDRVVLLKTDNPAVVTTLEFLEGINKKNLQIYIVASELWRFIDLRLYKNRKPRTSEARGLSVVRGIAGSLGDSNSSA